MSTRAPATTTPTNAPASKMSATPAVPHDRVAKRAYEKWVKGGCKHGQDQQNWLEAEQEIRAELGMGGTSGPAGTTRR